jgi:hypothetical protein
MSDECRLCGQGAIFADCLGAICPDCVDEGYAEQAPKATIAKTRADLATPLDDPRVKALVEALKEAERMLKHYGSRDAGGMAQIRAALEAIASPSISALEENK